MVLIKEKVPIVLSKHTPIKGESRLAKDIGKYGLVRYFGDACPDCGKVRWIEKINLGCYCFECAKKHKGEESQTYRAKWRRKQREMGPRAVGNIIKRHKALKKGIILPIKKERPSQGKEKGGIVKVKESPDLLNTVVSTWRNDPAGFIRDILGINLWGKQREIVESVRDNSRTVVRSCSAAGKTTVAACLVLWFLSAFRPSTILTTARSHRQVKEQLWREIRLRHAQAKIPIGGDITQTSLTLEDNWFALGFSTDEPERITGFHNKHVLVVIDEASGIGDEVFGAIDNPLAAGFTRLLLLGNPIHSVGKFRDAFTNANYSSHHISAFETPAFTGEEGFPFLISQEYVEQKKEEWGEDSPLYEVYILGNFPSGEGDRLIPFSYAESATLREIMPLPNDIIALGVDAARLGEDENVIYVRKGGKIIDSLFWKKSLTEGSIGRIVGMIQKHNPQVVNIDEGYNPGIIDGLRTQGYHINSVAFQGRARDARQFANARAEMWWGLAQKFKTEQIQIPNDKVLLKQLTDIRLRDPNNQNQMLIEDKKEIRKRGSSPDRGDALALCFYDNAVRELRISWI